MNGNVYSEIYINTLLDREKVLRMFRQVANGESQDHFIIIIKNCEIEIRKNEEYNIARVSQFPDGFLFFRYIVEIEGGSLEIQAGLITQVLELLWAEGIPAVAVFDQEDMLPENGGYKSQNVPWPK